MTASKSAHFDLTVDIVDSNDTRLSASHPGLHISRDAHWEFDDFADGDIFVLGPDNVWRLQDPRGAPWRTSTGID